MLAFKKVRPSRWMLAAALLVMVTLGACTGGPTEPSWGRISELDGNILVAFSARMVLIDPSDGSAVNLYDSEGNLRVDDSGNPRRWEVRAEGSTPTRFYTTPLTLSDTTLLAASYDSKLFEIDREAARITNPTGTPLAGHVVGNVIADETRLYVPLSESGLVAYNLENFDIAWRFNTQRGVWAQPLLADSTLYITSMDHFLYAVDAETGDEIWSLDLGGAVASTPVLYNDSLFVGTFARRIVRVSLDGDLQASYDTSEWVWGSPIIVEDTLYAADLGGYVYALRLTENGFREVWKRQTAGRAIRPSPLLSGDRLVVASRDHFVYWLNREDGETIVRHDVRAEVMAELLLLEPSETINISEPLVFVNTMSQDNLLFAFPADGNGEPIWKFPR